MIEGNFADDFLISRRQAGDAKRRADPGLLKAAVLEIRLFKFGYVFVLINCDWPVAFGFQAFDMRQRTAAAVAPASAFRSESEHRADPRGVFDGNGKVRRQRLPVKMKNARTGMTNQLVIMGHDENDLPFGG